MDGHLKSELEKAIQCWLEEQAPDLPWDGYVHDCMVWEMVNAAESVFDATTNIQEWILRDF